MTDEENRGGALHDVYHDCFVLLTGTSVFFFQAEDGIRDYYASRGLGDVYKRQVFNRWSAIKKKRANTSYKLKQQNTPNALF